MAKRLMEMTDAEFLRECVDGKLHLYRRDLAEIMRASNIDADDPDAVQERIVQMMRCALPVEIEKHHG
jgi:hypothetical protein